MGKNYLAGIDIGTTGAKAAVFDTTGHMVSSSYTEYTCSYPKPNWIEQDPYFLVKTAMSCLKNAIGKASIHKRKIRGLSISSQRSCTIFIDNKERLLHPMISWQDSRSFREVEKIREIITDKEYYNITGFPNNTTWLLSKILWFRKNKPKIWEKVGKVVQLQDFTLRQFGADSYYNDVSDSGFSGLWDTNNLEWSKKLLNIFKIDVNLLPKPVPSAIQIGKIPEQVTEKCGLQEGTPLCTGAGDQNSAAVGAGIVFDGYLSISMGTAGNANAYTDKKFRDPAGKIMVVNHAIKRRWQLEGHQAGAAGVFRWFRDEIGRYEKEISSKGRKDAYQLLNDLIAKTPAGSKGLVSLPFLAGAAAPRWNPEAKGILAGLNFSHDRGCLARAFIEGITLEMRDILDAFSSMGIKPKKVRIMGGSTKSKVWNQIQADTYNLPVETLKITDAAVLGAAIMAGAGTGVFKDITEGVKCMVKIDREYYPSPKNATVYDEIYDVYVKLYKAMDKSQIFHLLSRLQNK